MRRWHSNDYNISVKFSHWHYKWHRQIRLFVILTWASSSGTAQQHRKHTLSDLLQLGSTTQENQRVRFTMKACSLTDVSITSMCTGYWTGLSSLWSRMCLFSSHLCILGKPYLERQQRMGGFEECWVFQVAIIPHCNFKGQFQWLPIALGFDSWLLSVDKNRQQAFQLAD